MHDQPITPERAKAVYAETQSQQQTADRLGVSRGRVRTLLGARYAKYDASPATTHIVGVGTEPQLDLDAVWQAAFAAQTKVFAVAAAKRSQRVVLPDEPWALAMLSDAHFGSGGTDYRALHADADTIDSTEGMESIFHGDGPDNWIIGKLQGLQRGQALPFDAEIGMFADWLRRIKPKVAVAGNHENWTYRLAHIDMVRDALRDAHVLYDRQQVVFTLEHGKMTRQVVVRHKWRGSSVFNVSHGIETSWERGGVPFHWGIGGHTHIGTFCRPFTRHGVMRHAILTGSYKIVDPFADELGFAPPDGLGSGAMVMHPNGRFWWFDKLPEAAEFLTWLRSKHR